MRADYSRAGWYLLAALVLFSPLVQGGSPRLPTAVVQSAVFMLAAAWALEWGWRKPFQSLRINVGDGLLAFLLFLALFSYLLSPYQQASLRALLFLAAAILLYWYLVFHGSRKGVELFLRALVIQGVFQAVLVWYGWAFGGAVRPSGTFYNPNFAALFLAASCLVLLGRAAFPSGGRPAVRAAAAAAVLLTGGAVFLTQSRGGVLAFLAGAVVLLGMRSLKLLGALAAAAAALLLVPSPFAERIAGLSSMDVYAWSRLSIWKSALRMTGDHPWLGVGLGQYKYVSPRYAFPVDAHWAKYSRVAETPHSEYLHAGAELGVPGILVALAVLVLGAVFFARAARKSRGHDRMILAVLGSVVTAVAAHAAVDFPLHAPPLAILFAASAAGLRIFGVIGPSWVLEFRLRRLYAAAARATVYLAVRPVLAFSYFLGSIGAPQDLLREKWSLEEAERREVPDDVSIALLEKAVSLEPGNASYHNALGSRYFKYHFSLGGDDGEFRQKALYHASFAQELNPNNYRFAYSLGQAMESLHRFTGEGDYLRLAAEEYRLARTLAPRHYAMVEKAAFIEDEIGRVEDAEKGFRSVLDLEPNYVRGWYNLGMFLARQGRTEEALSTFAQAEALAASLDVTPMVPYEKRMLEFDAGLLKEARKSIAGTAGEESIER